MEATSMALTAILIIAFAVGFIIVWGNIVYDFVSKFIDIDHTPTVHFMAYIVIAAIVPVLMLTVAIDLLL